MNQAAKDAVGVIESLEYQEKWAAPDIRRAKIIAGLELLRGVAEGTHVIVPREPSEKQLEAARDWSDEKYGKPIGNDAAKGCYRAMITEN